MQTENKTPNPLDEKYLVIHTIDTLVRAYQALSAHKSDDKAKEAAGKISEMIAKIE